MIRINLTFIVMISIIASGCGDKSATASSSSDPSVANVASAPPVIATQPAPPPAIVEKLKFPLKVKEVGLGEVQAPCEPKEETYVDLLQKPVRIQLECSIGSDRDLTDVIFSIDGKRVVRVTRKQYLMPSDPEPGDVVNAAVKFYGQPKDYSEGNYLANYGDAYSISYNGNAASSSLNGMGIGLLIQGALCADGSYGTVKCGNKGTTMIKYDLIDIEAFNKQKEDGEKKLSSKNQDKVNNQKF